MGAVPVSKLTKRYKNSDRLNIFKLKIKQWTPNNCPCRICRYFIKNLGYI